MGIGGFTKEEELRRWRISGGYSDSTAFIALENYFDEFKSLRAAMERFKETPPS